MRGKLCRLVGLVVLAGFWVITPEAWCASAAPGLLKAKKDAEAKGFIFETSREEILAKAKKEGKLRVLSGLDGNNIKAMGEAFKKKYPFIDFHVEEITGTDAARRFILELKSGKTQNWDGAQLSHDFYDEYLPYMKKFDVLGMAEHGVLAVPRQMVDPVNRNVVAHTSSIQVVGYNNKLIAADKVPDTWEGFLKPEFKGRKFVADIRPTEIAALVPALGLEKTIDFARKLAGQEPIWVRGGTRTLTAMVAGEYALFIGPNYDSLARAQLKDPAKNLSYKIIEPVPTRLGNADSVLAAAANPYAALLWLEFQATPEGQKISDQHEPFGASIFTQGSVLESLIRGKKLSLVAWEHGTKMQQYQEKVVQAYGFPKAEGKR